MAIKIKKYTTEYPLQMIGDCAGICWGANTEDVEKNIKRAWDCIDSGHERAEEFPDIYMVIDGYSAKCLRELYTHIGGAPTRLQESTRYIDYEKGFNVVTPPSVEKNNDAAEVWYKAISDIKAAMGALKVLRIPNEDLTNLLPLAYQSKMVWKVNLRTLVHFMQKRKCTRSYWEIRNLCNEICKELSNYSEEWGQLVKALFVPECEFFGYCREKKSCGRKPKKNDIIK
jgi:thymidylate synthase (FAD)